MTVRLRPHHLLCVLTYVGRGYGPAFTANLTRVAERLAEGEAIEIIEGPDEICAPLLDGSNPHCHRASVVGRDRAARRDLSRLLGLEVRPGTHLVLKTNLVDKMRHLFTSGEIRAACKGCEWFALCGSIAANGFQGTVLTADRQ